MYMPGRFRTASRPSSTVISSAPYLCSESVKLPSQKLRLIVRRTRMNTSNWAGRHPPLRPGTGPTRKRSAGSSQACSRRRASRSGARIVRSPASTPLVQFRMSAPSRAKRAGQTSSASAPAAARQAAQTAASRASGTDPPRARPRIEPMSSKPLTAASSRMRPAAVDADHAITGLAELMGVGRRNQHLATQPQQAEQALRAAQVELAGDVVEQQHRSQAPHLAHQIGLGREQRQYGRSLLALRSVIAQVALALRDRELVVVRTGRRAPALDIAGAAGLELCQLTRLVLRSTRLVAQLDGFRELPDRGQVLGERLAQGGHEAAARAAD